MKAVIDTNVLLVANGQHDDASPECVVECVQRLQAMQREGIVVVDDGYRILGEYQNKTCINPTQGCRGHFLEVVTPQLKLTTCGASRLGRNS